MEMPGLLTVQGKILPDAAALAGLRPCRRQATLVGAEPLFWLDNYDALEVVVADPRCEKSGVTGRQA